MFWDKHLTCNQYVSSFLWVIILIPSVLVGLVTTQIEASDEQLFRQDVAFIQIDHTWDHDGINVKLSDLTSLF
jgi:hypothetical protein